MFPGQLADTRTRGLDDSRMPPTTACLVFVLLPASARPRVVQSVTYPVRQLTSPRDVQSASWQSASWRIRELSSYPIGTFRSCERKVLGTKSPRSLRATAECFGELRSLAYRREHSSVAARMRMAPYRTQCELTVSITIHARLSALSHSEAGCDVTGCVHLDRGWLGQVEGGGSLTTTIFHCLNNRLSAVLL